jgi:hypothetical protein
VVIAENAGAGSNQVLRYYPWEAEIGVWYVPDPENGEE